MLPDHGAMVVGRCKVRRVLQRPFGELSQGRERFGIRTRFSLPSKTLHGYSSDSLQPALAGIAHDSPWRA
jgi:hypothetical protein